MLDGVSRWGGTYLNNLISREGEEGDVCSVASHQVAVEDSQNTLVGDDEEIVLLSFKLENNRFKSDGDIVIGLARSAKS